MACIGVDDIVKFTISWSLTVNDEPQFNIHWVTHFLLLTIAYIYQNVPNHKNSKKSLPPLL